ncbi:MAG: hypothetical protein Q9186_002935 [Xanthomendoza sp. 1 TL-2023]
MAELYRDPDPGREVVSVYYLMQTIQELCENMFLQEEQRLLRLHHMLEICTLQHEMEVQVYQAAHRDLVKDEGEFIRMLGVPHVPQRAFKEWEKHVNQNMRGDRNKMRKSRQRTTALLRAIKYAEGRIRNVEKVIASEGKAGRLLSDSHQSVEQHMARTAVNTNVAEQINDEPYMQALMGDDAVENGVDQIDL